MAEKDRQEPKRAAHESETFAADFWKPHLGQNRFRSAAGRPGRFITGRLLPGTDLVEGILAMARSHEVASGYIDAFGSLAQARFSAGVRYSASQPERVERIPPENVEGPLEFLCGQGKFGIPSQGDPVIHFHGILVTSTGEVKGGHFFAGGNPVFATFEVVIHEILGVEQVWQKDEEAGVFLIEALAKE